MKNWLKIFKDEVESTPIEVMSEINHLEKTQIDLQTNLKGVQADLETKRLELLGSTGSASDVKKLKTEIEKLKALESETSEKLQALDTAIEKLTVLHGKALTREKDTEISRINSELAQIETDKVKLTEKLLKSAGETAALSYLLRGGNAFTISPQTKPLPINKLEGKLFYDSFDKIANGEIPLTQQQNNLITARNALANQ